MNLKNLNAVQLRIVLSILLVVLAGIGAGVFTYGYQQLGLHATAAQEIALQADNSQSSLQAIIAKKAYLEENTEVVKRAHQLVANSQKYEYQDQIINDINEYATKAGLQIASFTFEDSNAKTTKTSTATAAPAKTVAPAGVKSTTVSVAIKNPADYDAILRFVNLLQQSLFRMQISKVGLSVADATGATGIATPVTAETFAIEVYIR